MAARKFGGHKSRKGTYLNIASRCSIVHTDLAEHIGFMLLWKSRARIGHAFVDKRKLDLHID